jgi:CRP-like cAMP-binding protein
MALVAHAVLGHPPAVDAGLALLRTRLDAIVAIDDGDWHHIQPYLAARRFPRGSHLLRAGEPSDHAYFIAAGFVREYYTLERGVERIKDFIGTGRFTAAYSDFIKGRASQVSIQSLQDTHTFAISLRQIRELRRANPRWLAISHGLLEEMYFQKERRELQFLTLGAGERYRLLRDDFPGIEDVVPQYHLASYLGITPVALSRIRGRMRAR